MKWEKNLGKSGFTFIETIIVVAIILTTLGYAALNVLTASENQNVSASRDILRADIKSQQAKAMSGQNYEQNNADYYGIYFTSTSYTLFKGSSFDPNDPENYVINMENNSEFFNINLPSSSLIFSPLSGEVYGYSPIQNSLGIRNTVNGENYTFSINRYGAISTQ